MKRFEKIEKIVKELMENERLLAGYGELSNSTRYNLDGLAIKSFKRERVISDCTALETIIRAERKRLELEENLKDVGCGEIIKVSCYCYGVSFASGGSEIVLGNRKDGDIGVLISGLKIETEKTLDASTLYSRQKGKWFAMTTRERIEHIIVTCERLLAEQQAHLKWLDEELGE